MKTQPLWQVSEMLAAMSAVGSGVLPAAISGISIDSRTIAPGEAYFAIKGDVHDGHDFVEAALKNGAAIAVVSEAWRGKFSGLCLCWWCRMCLPAWWLSQSRHARDWRGG